MDEPIPIIRVRGQLAGALESDPHKQKKEVLDRYLQTATLPFHRVVRFLGERALENPPRAAYNAEIAKVGSVTSQHLKDTISEIRDSLKVFNAKAEQRRGPYVLRIETVPLRELPGRSDKKQPYRLVYQERSNARPAVALWQRLFADQPGDVRLLYDTDNVRSSQPGLAREGQFSGSGLVAAAAFVSQMLSLTQPMRTVRPRRYIDLGSGASMDRSDTCRIVLGPVSEKFEEYDFRHFSAIMGHHNYSFERGKVQAVKGERYTHVIRRSPTDEHPKLHETKFSTARGDKREEYAVVSYFKTPNRIILALEGMSSVSTLAAAVLMWDNRLPSILRELFHQEGVDFDSQFPSFELLVKVKVSRRETFEYVDIQSLNPQLTVQSGS